MHNVLWIVDASGSMAPHIQDVCAFFATSVTQQEADARVTVLQFASSISYACLCTPPTEVPPLTYQPEGDTALYDAMGAAMELAREQWGSAHFPYGKDRTTCITLTDGQDNASVRCFKEAIFTKIQARQHSGKWSFVYPFYVLSPPQSYALLFQGEQV